MQTFLIFFFKRLFLYILVQEGQCQDLPETWSYPESTANGWDGICATGLRQSPIELYSDELGKPNIHSNIKFNKYFSENSRNTFGYFKVISVHEKISMYSTLFGISKTTKIIIDILFDSEYKRNLRE